MVKVLEVVIEASHQNEALWRSWGRPLGPRVRGFHRTRVTGMVDSTEYESISCLVRINLFIISHTLKRVSTYTEAIAITPPALQLHLTKTGSISDSIQ